MVKKSLLILTSLCIALVLLVVWRRQAEYGDRQYSYIGGEYEDRQCCDMGVETIEQRNDWVIYAESRLEYILQNLNDNVLKVLYDTIRIDDGVVYYSLKNISGYDFLFRDSRWILAKCVSGRWRAVDFIAIVTDILLHSEFILANNEITNTAFLYYIYHGELLPGRYMLVRIFPRTSSVSCHNPQEVHVLLGFTI